MQWYNELSTEVLFTSYAEYARKVNERRPLSREDFGKWMTQLGCTSRRLCNLLVGECFTEVANGFDGTRRMAVPRHGPRPWAYRLGNLDVARAMFCTAKSLRVDWPQEEDEAQDPGQSADYEEQYLE